MKEELSFSGMRTICGKRKDLGRGLRGKALSLQLRLIMTVYDEKTYNI